jgi:hypothetical protein
MYVRFYCDPDTGEPHILDHGVTEAEETPMNEPKFPPGWDAERVRRLIAHYDALDEEQLVAEDEAAQEQPGQTTVVVPMEFMPTIREMLAHRVGA